MYILGIETSCDDTAAAVIEARGGLAKPLRGFGEPKFSVLSNISYSQVAIHEKFGGIVPNIASRAHLQKIAPTVKSALSISKINIKNIDLIAVTRGPGLMPSLLVGVNFARTLAYKWQKPIIGINHIEGHIYSNWLKAGKTQFPALVLIVSGGHTELVLMKDYGKYKIIGETLDDAAGECFDKTARILGFGFPGGPAIAASANKFKIKNLKFKISLPRPMIDSKDYNFSFSGLKTAVLYLCESLLRDSPNPKGSANPKVDHLVSAIAAEIQNAVIDVLIAKTLKAVKNYNPKSIMIAGGVSANKKLRRNLALKMASYKIPFFAPDFSYTTDNAAMIAAAGYFNYLAYRQAGLKKRFGCDSWKKIAADANLRL